MVTCETCNKRDFCTELCEKMEKFVNQDHVSQKEILIDDINKIDHLNMKDMIPTEVELDTAAWISLNHHTELTKMQKKYLYLSYWKRKSKAEIARRFNTSRQNVSQIIARVKKKKNIRNLKNYVGRK